jgi:hypothetical protein
MNKHNIIITSAGVHINPKYHYRFKDTDEILAPWEIRTEYYGGTTLKRNWLINLFINLLGAYDTYCWHKEYRKLYKSIRKAQEGFKMFKSAKYEVGEIPYTIMKDYYGPDAPYPNGGVL